MKCPICKKDFDVPDRDRPGSAYPFCSERCKLIDLGRWLSGRYQVPADPDEAAGEEHPDIDTDDSEGGQG